MLSGERQQRVNHWIDGKMEQRVPLTDLEKDQQCTTCLVTGGSSFIGSSLVKRLLACGHLVHTTSRDVRKLDSLWHLEGAPDRLKVFECDLSQPGSFDVAMKGCTHVFHVASPVLLNLKNDNVREKLLKPAVEGVENVLKSCSAELSVRRVVLTSSIAAMAGEFWEHGKDHLISEKDWNMCSSETFMPYRYSKVLAERKAWEMEEQQRTREHAWSLCVINPGFPFGPPVVQNSTSESIKLCKDMMKGKFRIGFPPIGMPISDVDQVAQAHVVAAFNEQAKGRYLCAAEGMSLQTLMKQCEEMFQPRRNFVGPPLPKFITFIGCKLFNMGPWDFVKVQLHRIPKIDNSKARSELMIDFYPGKNSLADMVRAIEESELKQT